MPAFACRSLMLLVLLLSPTTSEAQNIKLRITLQLPITTHIGENLMRFREEVGKASNREIDVEVFDRSSLYKDSEALNAVASGNIEMATMPGSWLGTKVPAVGIYDQPFMMNFEALVRAATRPGSSMRQPLDAAILEATGVRPLWWQSYGSYVFISRNGQHAKLPSAIVGKKIRVIGDTTGDFIKHCGGIPMTISATEQHRILRDGVVDMVITGITTVEPRELWQVADTVTRTEHGANEWPVIINEKFWQSLTARHRDIIVTAARTVEQELREKGAEIEQKAYDFARSKGMKIHDLTADEVADWRACSAPMIESFMNNTGEVGTRMMVGYGKLRTDPCCSAGPGGTFLGR